MIDFERTDSEAINATELVASLLENVKANDMNQGNKILRSWRAILESIHSNAKNGENIGRNLASHTRIVDFKNGILLIEADHTAWLQMLQLHQKYILGCLQRRFPELGIETLAFRIRGSKVGLSDSYERSLLAERKKQAMRYELEEKFLEDNGYVEKPELTSEEAYKRLPPHLQQIFDKLRVDVIANNQNNG